MRLTHGATPPPPDQATFNDQPVGGLLILAGTRARSHGTMRFPHAFTERGALCQTK
jgi:hypothetical protein